ncbi:MAG: Gfo/Idh/MocA family oxidoreductase [Gemmatimonadota bacterium]
MPSPERITIAVLGCGRIATRHARILGSFEGVRLAFASRSSDRARALARQYQGSVVFDSYDEAMAAPETDVILVTTPPDSHRSLALAAFAHDRHVIVEKPAFLTATDVDDVERAAAAAERQVLVAENYHYKPLLGTLRQLLESGVVGEVRLVRIDAAKWQETPAWLGHGAMEGLGALFEGGIHWLHLLAGLGLEIETVRGFCPVPPNGPERTMTVVAEYREGATGVLFHSWEIRSPLRGLRLSHIYGTRGTIGFESNGLFVRVSGRRSRLIFPGLRDITGHRAMWNDFLDAISHHREPRMTLALARRDLELVESAYRSALAHAGTEA